VGEFVGYVGPAEIHDAVIDRVDRDADRLVVVLGLPNSPGRGLQLEFSEPAEVEEEHSLGMTLYALAELEGEGTRRRFSFVNWEENDSAQLDLLAVDVHWTEIAI